MALIVQKYGGTSVGDAERIQAVADRIVTFRDAGNQVIVVVSAMSGETNRLETLGQSIVKNPLDREMDVLLASGEQVTIALLSMALHERGCVAKSYLGGQVCIRTDGNFGKA
ncbi:MAG: aspartate kinase, partial [Pseudomonadales bacterium]